MVAATVAEFQLVGASAQSQSYKLVPETNAEHWHFTNQGSNILLRIRHGVRIARTIGKKDTVWLEIQHFGSRGVRRHHAHPTPRLDQVAQDIELNAVVIRHDEKGRLET